MNKIKSTFFIFFILLVSISLVNAFVPSVQINYPSNNTYISNLEVNMNSQSVENTYVLPNINDSIIAWYSFENGKENVNSYGPANNFTAVSGSGTYDFIYGQGAKLNATVTSSGNPNLSADGFSIVMDFYLNTSLDSAIVNANFISFYSAGKGFQGYLSNSYYATYNFTQIAFNIYNGTNYSSASAGFRIYNIDITKPHRVVFNLNLKDGYAQTWVDGELHYTDSTIAPYGYFVSSNVISFVTTTNAHTRYIDEVIIINRSLNSQEAEFYSSYTDNLTISYTSYGNYNFSIEAVGYGNDSLNSSGTFNLGNLLSPQINYTYIVPNSTTILETGEEIDLYCHSTYSGVDDVDVDNIIQYSNNSGTNWTSIPSAWKVPGDYLILGDSMSYLMVNGYWPYRFKQLTGTDDSSFVNYAVAGKRCTYAYDMIQNNVSNGEFDDLFITCGVNGFAVENNTVHWENIYNEAKSKGINRVFMTTMPPWDYINDQILETAITLCNKMHTENAWLIAFGESHDDVYVYDLWTDWHDNTGTNLTDCGWDPTRVLTGDGVHPNTLSAIYWAEKQWAQFGNERFNTSMATFTAPSIEEDTNYSFRCYSEYGIRTSLVFNYDDILVKLDPPEPVVTISDHANDTNTIVFTAFGLIAVMIIASAGYIFFQILKGDMDISTVGILAITAVMVAVVLIVGFYILSIIANSIV